MELEEERDALRRELLGVQEMLAYVLLTVDEPVVVPKAVLKEGLPANIGINVEDEPEAFVFSLVER